jgi:hypothetical protein
MTVSILPMSSTGTDAPHGSLSTMSPSLRPIQSTPDDASDYGDFTLDEQDIINELLTNLASGRCIPEEPLELIDIEDYEEPRGVHLPRTFGKEVCFPPWMQPAPAPSGLADQTSLQILNTTNGIHPSFHEGKPNLR